MKRFLFAALLAFPAAVRADVTIRRVTSTSGFGGGFTSESTQYLKGTDERSDTSTTFQNPLMNKMAGGNRSDIILIGQDRMIRLDHAKKAYHEGTISEMGKMMEKASANGPSGKASQPSHRVTKCDFKVEPTGEKKTLDGYSCERVRVTMLMEIEDIKTGQKSEMRLVSDDWNAEATGDLEALRDAEAAFGKAFAAKMGADLSMDESRQWGLSMAMMMGVSQDQMKAKLVDLKKEFSKLKGFPVVTEVSWYNKTPGAQAGQPAAPPAAASGENMPSLSGGAGGIASGLAGMMMRKKMEAAAQNSAAHAQARANGDEPLFHSRTELRSIKIGSVDPGVYQIPAGYKKAEK